MLLHVSELTQPRVCLCAKYMCVQGGGGRKEGSTSAYANMLVWGKIVSTAQSNLLKRNRDSLNHPISTSSLSWALQQSAGDHGSSSPDLSGVWIRPAPHVISFDMVVLIGCTARIKKYRKALEGLTKSDFWKAA